MNSLFLRYLCKSQFIGCGSELGARPFYFHSVFRDLAYSEGEMPKFSLNCLEKW